VEFCGASLGLPSRGSRTADVTGIQTAAQPNKSICCKYKNLLIIFYGFFVQICFYSVIFLKSQNLFIKGQLISKGLFDAIISTKDRKERSDQKIKALTSHN
jgi:hypothetical protein